ncbi:MAG: transporter substrate-binding domain-containing protein [Chlamydiia bacterium]|nr:transporter substrate-binding domain-containing protein [Chlamydiia bacterium]
MGKLTTILTRYRSKIQALLFLSLSFFFLQSCGSSCSKQVVRIGVDSTWYPVDFEEMTSYVNGFLEELFLEISKESRLDFEWISANSGTLYEGLQQGTYRAVIGSKERYDFNLALYDFSKDILQLGPVLIVPSSMEIESLEEMKGKWIGTLEEDTAAFCLQPYPAIFSRDDFRSIPDLFNGIKVGEVDGALLDCIPATQYVSHLFYGELKIATPPLTPAGLRLITKKGDHLILQFDQVLNRLEKKKAFQELLAKWGLSLST